MTRIFIVLLVLISSLTADVKSTTGQIKFDTQSDNQAEMTLNSTGLGIGVSPSTNLHVNGNAIITNKMFVGGSSGSSNLNVNGTIGYGFQTVTSSTTLSGNSIVLADTSSGNIVLSLPEAISYDGRKYTVKKTSTLNNLFIRNGGFIDNYSDVSLSVNNMGSLSVISSSGNWHILNISGNGDLIAADNLVGWWKFDNSSGNVASDSSSYGNDGAITNFSSSNLNVEGKFSNAIFLDGINDYVNVPDSSELQLTGAYTISLWIYRVSDSGTWERLVSKSNGIEDYWVQIASDDTIGGGFNNASGFQNILDASAGTSISLNTWHLITIVFDGNSTLSGFLNGILDESGPITGAPETSTDPLRIGTLGAASFNYNGKIDDVRIYNKALTPSEIQALYNQGQ